MINVTLRQMRLFYALAYELSFTKAAAQVGLSQSALTAAIKSIEDELGVRLLDRTTRHVQLTPEGRQFLAVTERLLSDIDDSLGHIKAIAEQVKGRVTVSAASSILHYALCPAVARLIASHAGVTIRLLEHTIDVAREAVISAGVDFALNSIIEVHEGLTSAPVIRDQLGLLMATGGAHDYGTAHPEDQSVSWKSLDYHFYIALTENYGIRRIIDMNEGIDIAFRRPRCEVSSPVSLALLLREGIGYGIVPALTAQPLISHGLRFLPLEDPPIYRSLHILKRKKRGLSAAAAALVEQFAVTLCSLPTSRDIEVLFSPECAQQFIRE